MSGKWLPFILHTTTDPCTDVPQLQTVTPKNSAQQLWKMQQNSQHDNEIWKSNHHVWWHWACACSPRHCSPGQYTTKPQHTLTRWWIISQIHWGPQPSPWSSRVTGAFSMTPGITYSLEPTTSHQHMLKNWHNSLTKLQPLPITLQSHPTPRHVKNLCTQLCRNTQIPHVSLSDKWTSPHFYFKTSPHLMDKTPTSWKIGSLILAQPLIFRGRVKHT